MNEHKQLLDNVYKKFQTTMIGALAKFEDNFGYLWDSDTLESERFEMIWEDTRNSILNNGNKQARSAMNEIANYLNYSSNNGKSKYHYKFYFNKNRGDESYED